MLDSTSDLEATTICYNNLAGVDAMQLFKQGDDEGLETEILKLSLPPQRKAPNRIVPPFKMCSRAYSPHKYGYYPQSRKRALHNYADYIIGTESALPKCKRSKPNPTTTTWDEDGGTDVRDVMQVTGQCLTQWDRNGMLR